MKYKDVKDGIVAELKDHAPVFKTVEAYIGQLDEKIKSLAFRKPAAFVTRGFVSKADDRLLAGAAKRIAASIETPGDHLAEAGLLKAQIKDGLSSYLYEQTRRRPLVFPVIVEV